jgi:probable F420-dependent oxidoreductase
LAVRDSYAPVVVNLGQVGAWTFLLDVQPVAKAQEVAAEIEELGYGAVWTPEAVGRDALMNAELLLSATKRIVVGTGIAQIYGRDAVTMNAGWQTVSEVHPGRFVLGMGVSHQPMIEGLRGQEYKPPLTAMREYLDQMDAAMYVVPPPSEPPTRVLAALGPKMLELARDKAAGAHPYNVTPEHTAKAREVLGADRILAPEQMIVLETDAAKAREVARATLAIYFPGLPNYANSVRRLGFTEEDLTPPLSDRLVDALVAWGDVEAIRSRVKEHHDAGADHVAVQVLPGDDPDYVLGVYRELAPALL